MALKLDKKQVLIAKLIAQENITVIQNDASTASFNVETRVLTLPMWDIADEKTHMMLISHEVGHALWTPNDGWKKALKDMAHIGKDAFNIVEDIRIERLMIDLYPGLEQDYLYAYRNMFNGGLFGADAQAGNWKKYSFWDRLNIWGKMRGQVEVPMTDEELAFAKEAQKTETWDDVVDLVVRIQKRFFKSLELDYKAAQELAKKLAEEEGVTHEEFHKELSDQEIEIKEEDETPEAEFKSGQEFAFTDAHHDMMEAEKESEKKEKPAGEEKPAAQGSRGAEGFDVEDQKEVPTFTTVNALKDYGAKLSNSVALGGKYTFAKSASDNFDFNQCVTDINQVMAARYDNTLVPVVKKKRADVKKAAGLMAKEFEMRQTASRLARARESTKGSLDVNKLHSYKFNDKLFKQVTTVGDGQSHCAVMLVDYSHSMSPTIANVCHQVAILATFCRMVKIPFRVFAFTSGYGQHQTNVTSDFDRKHFTFANLDTKMAELINSTMPKKEFNDAIGYLLGPKIGFCPVMRMGGTPLASSVLVAHELLVQLQQEHNVQKRNLIMLTDGQGSGLGLSNWKSPNSYLALETKVGRIYFKNGYSAHEALLEGFRKRGTTVVGYDIQTHVPASMMNLYVDMIESSGLAISKIRPGFDRHIYIDQGFMRKVKESEKKMSKFEMSSLDATEFDSMVQETTTNRKMSRAIARNVSEAMG